MGATARRRLENETDLRRSIDHREFELYFQPAVDLRTRRIEFMEALVRWHHPQRGLVSPGEFIPLAEETGLIVQLGRWVLEEACRQVAEWRSEWGELAPRMTVNVSARQLQLGSVLEDVSTVLKQYDLPPDYLTMEITETFAVEDAVDNRKTLEQFKALGIGLAIDDFGSGYSSLGYVKRLPVDLLKIDRGFIQSLGNGDGDVAIVELVTRMAHARGMRVVAEGVETAEMAAKVRALGCDLGQGYHFAKPLPAGIVASCLPSTCERRAPRAPDQSIWRRSRFSPSRRRQAPRS